MDIVAGLEIIIVAVCIRSELVWIVENVNMTEIN